MDVTARGSRPRRRVAVIGAGIAGLSAARVLHDEGFAVSVLERGRSVGGRAAHRRTEPHRFDHGAQYLTVRDARFAREVDAWLAAGLVAPWTGHIVALEPGGTRRPVTALARYVGVPGMNAMAKHLARGLDVSSGFAVSAVSRDAGTWFAQADAGQCRGPFDTLVVAMPPEQAARLSFPGSLLNVTEHVHSIPCWCAMVAFESTLPVHFDGAFVNHAVLDWIARDSSKPGRPAGERWAIHARGGWSAERLADAPYAIARQLVAHFFDALGLDARDPAHLAGHRWSFARPTGKWHKDCVWHADHAVALCGDWCLGGRVEGAFLSGMAAAGQVIGAAADRRPVV